MFIFRVLKSDHASVRLCFKTCYLHVSNLS